jgi:uncharacterized membrane-anchored protein
MFDETRRTGTLIAKVPEVTAVFWVLKVLTTGMGEAASDWLAAHGVALAAGVGLLGLGVTLWYQLRADRYRPVTYWSTVAMVAVFGTMAADAIHVVLGVPYPITSTAYALAVVVCLAVWRRIEGTLSIHSITTRRRELFYWATVLATFALGTAAGDLTAITLKLGYLESGLIFLAAILIPWAAWRWWRLNEVVAFWAAYVLTRPLGASFADWIAKPATRGAGLGVGDAPVTVALVVVIAALVVWIARSRHGVQPPQELDAPNEFELRSVEPR